MHLSPGDDNWSLWELPFPGFIGIELKAKQFPCTFVGSFFGMYIVLNRSPLNPVALVYLGQCEKIQTCCPVQVIQALNTWH